MPMHPWSVMCAGFVREAGFPECYHPCRCHLMDDLIVSSLQRRKLLRWAVEIRAAMRGTLFMEEIAQAFFLAFVAGAKGIRVC